MFRRMFIVLCFVAPCLANGNSRQEVTRPAEVWDKMVNARGGRALLANVEAFAVSIDEKNQPGWQRPDVMAAGRSEIVAAPPDRLWMAADYRPASMGLTVRLWNRAGRLHWSWINGGPSVSTKWTSESESEFLQKLEELQLVYFLETAHLRPRVLNAVQASSGFIEVEVATPHFVSATYLVDKATWLPASLRLRPLVPAFQGRDARPASFTVNYRFGQYADVSGVRVPIEISNLGHVSLQINPPLDSKLFEIPPDPVSAVDHWRRFIRKGN